MAREAVQLELEREEHEIEQARLEQIRIEQEQFEEEENERRKVRRTAHSSGVVFFHVKLTFFFQSGVCLEKKPHCVQCQVVTTLEEEQVAV